jgi:hypothetical protein
MSVGEFALGAMMFGRIVPPGTDLDPADNYAATPPAIERAELRRRRPSAT